MPDIDQILSARREKRRTASVVVALDPVDADEWHELRAAVAESEKGSTAAALAAPETDPAPVAELEAFEAELLADEGRTAEFTMTSIGRSAYEALRREHLPTDEQRNEAGLGARLLRFNIDTFPPALVAASCTSPEMTGEEALELFDLLDPREADALFMAAQTANGGPGALDGIDLGKRSRRTPTSAG